MCSSTPASPRPDRDTDLREALERARSEITAGWVEIEELGIGRNCYAPGAADHEHRHLPQPPLNKSRQALQLLREQGIEPEIIKYLDVPPEATSI